MLTPTVEPNSSISDIELERRATAYLRSRSFSSFRALTVQSHRGVVTVTGRLPTFHERQVAQATCRRVAGVLKVVDAIEVVSPESATLRRSVLPESWTNLERGIRT